MRCAASECWQRCWRCCWPWPRPPPWGRAASREYRTDRIGLSPALLSFNSERSCPSVPAAERRALPAARAAASTTSTSATATPTAAVEPMSTTARSAPPPPSSARAAARPGRRPGPRGVRKIFFLRELLAIFFQFSKFFQLKLEILSLNLKGCPCAYFQGSAFKIKGIILPCSILLYKGRG